MSPNHLSSHGLGTSLAADPISSHGFGGDLSAHTSTVDALYGARLEVSGFTLQGSGHLNSRPEQFRNNHYRCVRNIRRQSLANLKSSGAMNVVKPCEFIQFSDIDGLRPSKFARFWRRYFAHTDIGGVGTVCLADFCVSAQVCQ